MDILQKALERLYPDKNISYQTSIEYSLRLQSFNSNIKLTPEKISMHLNLLWKDIDEEIKIGLAQTLILKVFKDKSRHTPNITLYNNFLKNIPLLIPKTKIDAQLHSSFERVNQHFFRSELDLPNLCWGQFSLHKLASYNFHNDTIKISPIFREANPEIIDYLMYHELLHKHHKFQHKNGRSRFHTTDFRRDEESYPHKPEIEKELTRIITKHKKRKWQF